MATYNHTLTSQKNKHLSAYERGQIQFLHSKGLSPYAIGKQLGRASNTIRNELKRGTVSQIKGKSTVLTYFPDTGEAVYKQNRLNCGPKFKLFQCEAFIQHVTKLFWLYNI